MTRADHQHARLICAVVIRTRRQLDYLAITAHRPQKSWSNLITLSMCRHTHESCAVRCAMILMACEVLVTSRPSTDRSTRYRESRMDMLVR